MSCSIRTRRPGTRLVVTVLAMTAIVASTALVTRSLTVRSVIVSLPVENRIEGQRHRLKDQRIASRYLVVALNVSDDNPGEYVNPG
ncbi:MAG: hypothetical protein O3B13_15415, partial [Planctomycetota bacterium]|nr:hypothetical protein [Planctomycetota bacterium]